LQLATGKAFPKSKARFLKPLLEPLLAQFGHLPFILFFLLGQRCRVFIRETKIAAQVCPQLKQKTGFARAPRSANSHNVRRMALQHTMAETTCQCVVT
ncbi:MAG TPA: hypothetical protein PKD31_30255, partial [Blastocatellia bacterium]|nr:hypothetical protein [Blastocatellia bacterium]